MQLFKKNQEARNSVRTEKEEAYLLGQLCCVTLLEITIFAPLEHKVVLMTLLPMLRLILSLERSIYGAV